MNSQEQRKEEIDFISRLNGYGSLASAQSNNLRGLNVNLNGTPAPANKDSYGYTFFTRPDLNLSYDNLAMDRMMTPLMSSDTTSMARALRVMLDPRSEGSGILSDLCDPSQAFIPILSNNLITLSGWPDLTVETYTSKEGNYKEAYSMVDGTTHIFNTFDATAVFRNIQGDPITLLFAAWVRYSSLVYDGTMVPYFDNIIENTIDYQTRIYRLITNADQTHVQKIGACGAAFPQASPLGSVFNYSNEENYNEDNSQISIPMRCIGVNYLDPILVKEFNDTVAYRSNSMRDGNRSVLMTKISKLRMYPPYGNIGKLLQNVLTHKLYPHIDPETMELEWWAKNGDFQDAINELKAQKAI